MPKPTVTAVPTSAPLPTTTVSSFVDPAAEQMVHGASQPPAVFPWASTRDAVLEVLRQAEGESLSVSEILAILHRSSWKANSDSPETVVRAALSRLNQKGEIRRTKPGRYMLLRDDPGGAKD